MAAAVAAGVALLSALATQPALAQRRAPEKVHGATLATNAHNLSQKGAEHARMKSAGMNTVSLAVWWIADETLNTIRPDQFTEPDAELGEAIDAAHRNGMSVALMPMFHCDPCALSRWRGHIKPRDREAFYDDYVDMIDHYGRLAEAHGVELLFLGSELTSLQGDTAEWRRIAAAARGVFSGELVYDVNWDAIGGVHFWDSVDVPSISAYFPLTEEARPSVADLKAAWRDGKQKLSMGVDAYATVEDLAKRTGKQVLFGEAGYRSREFAARQPFDSVATNGSPSEEVQANAYQALLETFGDRSWWRGVLWWVWEVEALPDPTGFSPRENQAETVLKRWFVDGIRPNAGGIATPAPVRPRSRPGVPATPAPSSPEAATTVPPTSVVDVEPSEPTEVPGPTIFADDHRESSAAPAAGGGADGSRDAHRAGAAAGAVALIAAVAGLGGYTRRRFRNESGPTDLDPMR
ncbi:MAG: glycoside hydrolase family 113 [Acidimicrobiia bacterium]